MKTEHIHTEKHKTLYTKAGSHVMRLSIFYFSNKQPTMENMRGWLFSFIIAINYSRSQKYVLPLK